MAAIFGVIKRQKSAKMDLRATLVETRAKNKGTKTQTSKAHRFLKVYWREAKGPVNPGIMVKTT